MPALKTSRILSTLCSKRLEPSDCIDISGKLRPTLRLSCGSTYIGYPRINASVADHFPPNTRGFLYYHTPPKAPPLVGEVRFRCASNLDDFHNGKDLLLKDKFTPWSIPPYALSNHASYAKWRDQLILDNLVTQATLDKWITTKNEANDTLTYHSRLGPDRPVLYYITQPFVFRFNSCTFGFYTATKDEISRCLSHNPLKDLRHGKIRFPYGGELSSWIRIYMNSWNFRAGSGLVRLEPFVHPKCPEQHQVAVRVLKIIEPVKALVDNYDGHVHQPTEGALIQRSNTRSPFATFGLNQSLKGAVILPVNFDDLP